MKRRGNVIQGRFGRSPRRIKGLPLELAALLEVEKKRRRWRRYLPLWAGAVVVGTVVGVGWGAWQPRETHAQPVHASNIAPATMLQEQPRAEDEVWARSPVQDAVLPSAGKVTRFGFCHVGAGYNCVVDGDTIWIAGEKVRVADIDAPETHDYRCSNEKALGDRATQRLIELVNSGTVTLKAIDRDEDVYGRRLRLVYVNGTSVGDTLVSEGLARYYEGGRRPWC